MVNMNWPESDKFDTKIVSFTVLDEIFASQNIQLFIYLFGVFITVVAYFI